MSIQRFVVWTLTSSLMSLAAAPLWAARPPENGRAARRATILPFALIHRLGEASCVLDLRGATFGSSSSLAIDPEGALPQGLQAYPPCPAESGALSEVVVQGMRNSSLGSGSQSADFGFTAAAAASCVLAMAGGVLAHEHLSARNLVIAGATGRPSYGQALAVATSWQAAYLAAIAQTTAAFNFVCGWAGLGAVAAVSYFQR